MSIAFSFQAIMLGIHTQLSRWKVSIVTTDIFIKPGWTLFNKQLEHGEIENKGRTWKDKHNDFRTACKLAMFYQTLSTIFWVYLLKKTEQTLYRNSSRRPTSTGRWHVWQSGNFRASFGNSFCKMQKCWFEGNTFEKYLHSLCENSQICTYMYVLPQITNISPEIRWLEDYFPLNWSLFRWHVHFREVYGIIFTFSLPESHILEHGCFQI